MDARPFERRQVLDLEASIPGPAGDHNGTGPDPFIVRETDPEPLAIAAVLSFETHHLVRYRHLGAELLCLVEGAGHQRHPTDAGREPQVVLDPRRSPRLPPECAAIEHDDGQAFRCAVDGRGQTGRSGADDRQVVHTGRIDGPYETETPRELDLARIPQHAAVRAEHDRQLLRIDVEALDECPRARVGVGVDLMVWMAVACEESGQPQHVGISSMPDDHRSADAALE